MHLARTMPRHAGRRARGHAARLRHDGPAAIDRNAVPGASVSGQVPDRREPSQLDTPEGRLLATQFNSVVAENAMKPSRIQPGENKFNFAPADAIVDFARQHGMAVRDHALPWYKRTPDWSIPTRA